MYDIGMYHQHNNQHKTISNPHKVQKDWTIGCSVEWKCLVAYVFFDESKHAK